jgi:hypothetical protein
MRISSDRTAVLVKDYVSSLSMPERHTAPRSGTTAAALNQCVNFRGGRISDPRGSAVKSAKPENGLTNLKFLYYKNLEAYGVRYSGGCRIIGGFLVAEIADV